MTRDQILQDWNMVGTAKPKKGQFFLACPNHNPNGDKYDAVQCQRTFKRIVCTILEKKTN